MAQTIDPDDRNETSRDHFVTCISHGGKFGRGGSPGGAGVDDEELGGGGCGSCC